MTRSISLTIYAIVMIVIIVSVDLLFFKGKFLPRLIINIGIVLIFIAFYFRFLKIIK